MGTAEDLAQDAFVAALEKWPETGVPDRPGAWLMTTARRRGLDQLRRRPMLERSHAMLAAEQQPEAPVDDPSVGDDLLRLIFLACHPVLSNDSQVALTLRLVAGLTTEEIARAFLVPPATMGQRISRAKKTLSEARVPFEMPDDLEPRLAGVLRVVYLVYNEGYAASAGDRWIRDELCGEALRMGRVLAALMPNEREVHGLLALMELQSSRFRARVGPDGAPVLLEQQNRAHWDRVLIRRGLAGLNRALAAGPPGPYTIQAAIAACHARARSLGETDWGQMVALYDALLQLQPSPVVELNRAVALSRQRGAAPALADVDGLREELSSYPLFHAVRADLLARLGRTADAVRSLERAASLTTNTVERTLLLARAASLHSSGPAVATGPVDDHSNDSTRGAT